MTLNVIDFYTRKKLSIHPSFNVTMIETEFTMLVEHNKRMKEFVLNVPKKYMFKRTLLNCGDFKALKLKEYNVLSDFIKNNKEMASLKWHLEEGEVGELLASLEMCLIMNHTNCSFLRKCVLMAIAKLNLTLAKMESI